MFIKIPPADLMHLTDAQHERNMYAHPNPVARGIFWQRLEAGHRLLRDVPAGSRVLDFGGGSGAFLPALARRFADVTVVDLDLNDARRVAAHYQLKNVRLAENDISKWANTEMYDLVVTMDVLEHFADKSVPLRFLDSCLKPNGLLLVSLPTENWLYRLGRAVLRKTKPADHYHPAHALVRYYRESGYTLLTHRYVPRLGPLALPLFYIGLFRKTR
jgi:2-polyprenyl-3-methyl-5-hydroxy-6-metoxy-1,4-benzoquinol methylase